MAETREFEGISYKISHREISIPMDRALNCLDRPMCESACKSCPRYGTSWSCPPFDKYNFAGLYPERYDNLILILTKITTQRRISLETARSIFNNEMRLFMPSVRRKAKELGGVVYGFACSCDLCSQTCARIEKQPCRFPLLAGPSLEAAGFNVGMLLTKFGNEELSWSDDGFAPASLTYVSAIAYS